MSGDTDLHDLINEELSDSLAFFIILNKVYGWKYLGRVLEFIDILEEERRGGGF